MANLVIFVEFFFLYPVLCNGGRILRYSDEAFELPVEEYSCVCAQELSLLLICNSILFLWSKCIVITFLEYFPHEGFVILKVSHAMNLHVVISKTLIIRDINMNYDSWGCNNLLGLH